RSPGSSDPFRHLRTPPGRNSVPAPSAKVCADPLINHSINCHSPRICVCGLGGSLRAGAPTAAASPTSTAFMAGPPGLLPLDPLERHHDRIGPFGRLELGRPAALTLGEAQGEGVAVELVNAGNRWVLLFRRR